jgi:ribonuclease P protein component
MNKNNPAQTYPMAEHTHRLLFRHRHRLHGNRAFASVFDAKLRKSAGPVTVCGKPNGLDYCRLGLSVPRRVGSAIARSRVKRRLREAFRLSQHDWPVGYDLIVVVRPHKLQPVTEYQNLLGSALVRIHKQVAEQDGQDTQPVPEP